MISIIMHPTSVIAQTSSSDVSKKAHDAWVTFKSYVSHQKDDATEHGKELLKDADDKIEEMEKKAANASGESKVKYQESIKKLKKMRSNIAKKLDELEKSSPDNWEATKHGFADAYKDLHNAYEEATDKSD
jgi:hypothetical protein